MRCPNCNTELSTYSEFHKEYYEKNKERINKARAARYRKSKLLKKGKTNV